jgi:hypothetical protein
MPDLSRLTRFLFLALCLGLAIPTGGAWADSSSKKPKVPDDPYTAARRMMEKGDYGTAIPILEDYAKRGHGYEMAQLALGQALIASAEGIKDPQEQRDARAKGAAWILRAADANWHQAQEALVELLLRGGAFKVEAAEAGKWYLIWLSNHSTAAIGVTEFNPVLVDKLKSTLTKADWEEAQKKAQAWRPDPEAVVTTQ